MKRLICLDTMVLIWGVQGRARHASEAPMIGRTRRFFDSLIASEQFMVPTPALSEYLQWFTDPAERRRNHEAVERRCVVLPFDAACAEVAAQLGQRRRGQSGAPRQMVKVDEQIVATAIVHHVTGELDRFRAIAGDDIEVCEVLVVQVQSGFPWRVH